MIFIRFFLNKDWLRFLATSLAIIIDNTVHKADSYVKYFHVTI
jgi:hypothetical protein